MNSYPKKASLKAKKKKPVGSPLENRHNYTKLHFTAFWGPIERRPTEPEPSFFLIENLLSSSSSAKSTLRRMRRIGIGMERCRRWKLSRNRPNRRRNSNLLVPSRLFRPLLNLTPKTKPGRLLPWQHTRCNLCGPRDVAMGRDKKGPHSVIQYTHPSPGW